MKKYENFCKALTNLQEITDYHEPYRNVELTGMVALFEICFEQAWKAMKEVLEASGLPEGKTGSPKMILKTAYQAGMINDETMWLSALESRNNATHAYNEAIALDIVQKTKDGYIAMFELLKANMQADWLDK